MQHNIGAVIQRYSEAKKNIDPWEKMKVVMQTEIHVAKACIRSTYDEKDIMQTALDTEVQ